METSPVTESKKNGYSIVPALREVAVEDIAKSPTQPRTNFAHLDELAESIKEHGIFDPLLLRPKAGKSTSYECVDGERRLRAARIAGLKGVPAIVREMKDEEVRTVQLVGFAQREDLHFLEEADAFASMANELHISAEEIAARVVKPVAHIKQRLKLTKLCKKAREACRTDLIDAARALLLARIPHEDLQVKALEHMTRKTYDGELPSYVACVHMVQREYMLVLQEAPFDRADGLLVAKAGPCNTCEKRTGNQPELFGDVKSKDTCSDPKCYREKLDAHWAALVAEAKTESREVLSPKEAAKIFSGSHLTNESGYVDLDKSCYKDTASRTWREVLKKRVPPITLARDEIGIPHFIVDEKDAMKAAREAGFAWAKPAAKKSDNVDAKKEREKADRRKRLTTAIIAAVVEKVEGGKDLTETQWRAFVRGLVACTHQATIESVLKRRGGDEDGKKLAGDRRLLNIATASKGAELRGLAVEIVASYGNAFELGTGLRELAAAFKVDIAKVTAAASAAPKPPPTKPETPKAKKK